MPRKRNDMCWPRNYIGNPPIAVTEMGLRSSAHLRKPVGVCKTRTHKASHRLNPLAAFGLLRYPVPHSWWEDSGVYGCEIRGPVGRSGLCGPTGQHGDSANSAGG